MGGWGSGRQGGRVTIGGCDSYRLALKDLGDLLRSPANKVVWLSYGQNGEHRMTVVVEARPEPWLRAPAAPVTRVGPRGAHGLYGGPDVDRGRVRRPALVVLLPGLKTALCGPLSAARVPASSAAPRAMAWPTA